MDWSAVAAIASAVAAIGAMVASISVATKAAYIIGKLEGTVNNGLTAGIKEIKESLTRVWARLDKMPYQDHTARIEALGDRLERVERQLDGE